MFWFWMDECVGGSGFEEGYLRNIIVRIVEKLEHILLSYVSPIVLGTCVINETTLGTN